MSCKCKNIIENFQGGTIPLDTTFLQNVDCMGNIYSGGTNLLDIFSTTTSSGSTGGGTFTGNTSATCINELWVSNISGCSPVTIGTELVVSSSEGASINGHLTVISTGSTSGITPLTGDTVFLVQDNLGNHIIECKDSGQVHVGDLVNSADPDTPTLMIGAGKAPNDRGSLAFTSDGIGIGGDNDSIGDYLYFQLPTSTGSRWRLESSSQFGYTLISRQNNLFGSGAGMRNSFYTSRSYGMDFLLGYNNAIAVADTVGYRFNTKDTLLVGANDVERFVIENGALETNSYFINIKSLGVGTPTPSSNARLHISGDTLVSGSFTANTMTLSNVSAFADDSAAGTGGLVTGDVYQTSGAGAAPLNAAGILMIKQ